MTPVSQSAGAAAVDFSFFVFNPGDLNFLGQKIYYNNNNHDNVYDAVIMTKVVARVHPVHLMNVD